MIFLGEDEEWCYSLSLFRYPPSCDREMRDADIDGPTYLFFRPSAESLQNPLLVAYLPRGVSLFLVFSWGPARGGDSVPFYGCGEVDEDRGGVLTMVIRWRGRKPSDYCWDLVGRPPRYANVATSEYVPTPNPSTTTEHKTLSVSEDEYTKFFQYQAAKL